MSKKDKSRGGERTKAERRKMSTDEREIREMTDKTSMVNSASKVNVGWGVIY